MTVKIDKGKALDGINLTPMIDCVFLLLIFFLVATRFEEIERENAQNIKSPEASEAVPLTAKVKELFVNVDRNGRFFVRGEQVDRAELGDLLLQAASNNPGTQSVVIRGDRECPFQHIVTVTDLCNKAHIRDYMVTTIEPTKQ
jgi:biopolymer transport protein ExbD